jgi:hypothetical protein
MRASTALMSIELQAMKVLEREMDRYLESQVPVPSSLVQLLKATHDMIMKRCKSTLGLTDDGKTPREMLVEVRQLASELEQAVERENSLELQ